jgi:hypothetical protein
MVSALNSDFFPKIREWEQMNGSPPLKALALTFKALIFAHTMYLFVFHIVTYMGDYRRGLHW